MNLRLLIALFIDNRTQKKLLKFSLQKFPNLIFQPIDFVTKGNVVILEYVDYPKDSIKAFHL